MLPEAWANAQRLLAIRLDNIGDVVMLGPAFRSLRRALPRAQITLMASPAGTKAAPLLPWIDDVLTLRAVWQDASSSMPLDPGGQFALIDDLRLRCFDAALIFTSFSQSPWPPAYACYMAGIPLRAGQSKEFGGSVLSHWIRPPDDAAHQTDRNLHMLESLGFETAGRELELRVPEGDDEQAERLLDEAGIDPDEPFIVLAPGASCSARRYDPMRFAEAAKMIADASGLPLVTVGGERDRAAAEPTIERARARSLIGRDTIPRLAAILSRATLVITNNSGPMHIADAFRRPMVVLYSGAERMEQWRPRSAPARLLRREVACSPCYRFECPYSMECLDLPPEEVAGAALELLETARPGRSLTVAARIGLVRAPGPLPSRDPEGAVEGAPARGIA